MMVTIHGKRWRIKFCKLNEATLGECDSPDTPKKEIRIREDLKGQQKLDTLCHEIFHAVDYWRNSEEFVDGTGTALATILWRLGLRWSDENEE